MNKKLVLQLPNHDVYYIKNETVNYYITIPKNADSTNICIELKSKMNNYNLDLNDEVWVMENVKNTFSFIDEYNITLVLPILNDEFISALEKIDTSKYEPIDKLLGYIINDAYKILKSEKKEIANQIILVNNERYKTFTNWFTTRYKNRVICKSLLEIIQYFNANATSYKKLETPVMTFVVGSYNTEVTAPKIDTPEEKQPEIINNQPKLQVSSGFTSYWLLALLVIAIAAIGAIVIAFTMK